MRCGWACSRGARDDGLVGLAPLDYNLRVRRPGIEQTGVLAEYGDLARPERETTNGPVRTSRSKKQGRGCRADACGPRRRTVLDKCCWHRSRSPEQSRASDREPRTSARQSVPYVFSPWADQARHVGLGLKKAAGLFEDQIRARCSLSRPGSFFRGLGTECVSARFGRATLAESLVEKPAARKARRRSVNAYRERRTDECTKRK
jgi:hypothetical protein